MMSNKAIRLPRYFAEVIFAISELKEREGSNFTKIVSHVKALLMSEKCGTNTPKTVSKQVRRVLEHAETQGIVKQRAGKFKMNTDILNLRSNLSKHQTKGRRRKKRKKKQRRQRHRHQKHCTTPKSVSVPVPSEPNHKQNSEIDDGINSYHHPDDNQDCFVIYKNKQIQNFETDDE